MGLRTPCCPGPKPTMLPSTTGWTVSEWLAFHADATPSQSYDALLALLSAQLTDDKAWLALASPDQLSHQWAVLQLRADKALLPLYGVPVAVKDNIDVRGLATTAACPAFTYNPQVDAATVAALRSAGAIVIGKTNLDQFATGLVGTRSPYGFPTSSFSDKHVLGGLSLGLALVVARGIVPLALGTDTAGSGRVPAMLNNLVGIKPTRGLLSLSGVVPACKLLDCVLILSLNLADGQKALQVLSQPDEEDAFSRTFPGSAPYTFGKTPRVAVPTLLEWYGEEANPVLYAAAVKQLQAAGCELVPVDIAPLLELARMLYEGPWVAERYVAIRDFIATNPAADAWDPTVKQIILGGEKVTGADAFAYDYQRQAILSQILVALRDIDALVVPTAPLNPTIAEVQAEPVAVNSKQGTYTNFVNLADMAALAVPAGFRPDGLPFGITLLGKAFTDYALLDLAHRYLKQQPHRPVGAFNGALGLGDELDAAIPAGPAYDTPGYVSVAVVGAHLKGLPLHWQLEACNARLQEATTTSPNYRLYALPKVGPVQKPGLRRVEEGSGAAIAVEVYAVPVLEFGRFVAFVPEPLGIGSAELASGRWVKLFICEEAGYTAKGCEDITELGGWRAYQQQLATKAAAAGTKAKPFNLVLVANRGEIAVRIIKTLKRMGIRLVAVYSDPDKYAKHVLEADVAVALHGTSAAETYINIDKVIAACKLSGAEAVIPGYGFLSENADFADRVEAEGLVFVGPTGSAIRLLGLKHSAREIAERANVPLVPGSGLVETAAEAAEIAAKLTYPVMVKLTAGGGGIGLQKVDLAEDIERVFETVKHQGQAYFGDSGVFLERFVEDARHVEIQLLGDGKGRAIAVGERDCLLQRRNQKVIEETPAPNFPEATRQRMRTAAELLGAEMHYRCAGTVEFIYDQKRDEFYFLEVNARLQVEHPITEMVTGLDLVEWMVRIAAGDAPLFDQKITVTGALMEARLYAENPVKDFMPLPGQITEIKFPEWARIDGWAEKGTVVLLEYDPTLAKIIVHGVDRDDALAKLRQALNETVVHGCVTNIDYLRSIANSTMFAEAKMHTKILDTYDYTAHAFEITQPGAYTTVQDYPGRVEYWRIGVPPSGPMDDYAFRLANRAVGNHYRAPAIEITLNGPTLVFHSSAVVAVTGGSAPVTVNGEEVPMWEPVTLNRGDKLAIGKLLSGCRAYLAIRGGIDVTEYLGLRSTFALGNLGGHNGRVLKLGDVLFLGQPGLAACTLPAPVAAPAAVPKALVPDYNTKHWEVAVTCGPHGAPDFFKEETVKEFFALLWKVHYNLNRFGVRLIGPKPQWARADGGEAGLHPSNTHDYVYSLGAINFTGDEPVILTCDGPSLGGFVCQAVVALAELWKIGQVKPGDSIQFVPITYGVARELREAQDTSVEKFTGAIGAPSQVLETPQNPLMVTFQALEKAPTVAYRQAGDRYVLVEYGENLMDINVLYRVHKLIEMVELHQTVGIVEMLRGVRLVLVEFDGYKILQAQLVATLVAYEKEIAFVNKWLVPLRVIRLPMAFEDKKTLAAVTRYQETIRAEAPWLPNNVDFIASINGIERQEVHDMLYAAKFLVLGLGDVFLGAPVAVPLDPRHRYLGTKYNPLRTFTPNGTVGIGGMYMCIYTMELPGGYQLVGRTIPIWDKLTLMLHLEEPWLLRPFDQVEFYPALEAEVDRYAEQCAAGKYQVEIVELVFDHGEYLKWIQANLELIRAFQQLLQGDKLEEFNRLIQVLNAELASSGGPKIDEGEKFSDDAELVYSEYSGRFWKPLVQVGDVVKAGDGLVVVEAMKTEMVVTAPRAGKVVKVVHVNGDMVDAGDMVAVLE